MNTTNIDAAWFTKNPQSNMRLRRPGPGEVEELTRIGWPSSAYELAAMGGTFPPPTPDVEWWVMVISAGDTLIRLLTIRDKGAVLRPDASMCVYVIGAGDRVAISTGAP